MAKSLVVPAAVAALLLAPQAAEARHYNGTNHNDKLKGKGSDDVLRVGPGADEVYGESGGDTIYLLDDGAADIVYCGTVAGGEPGDRVVLVNGRDPLDDIRNCPPPVSQRLSQTEWRVSSTFRTAAAS